MGEHHPLNFSVVHGHLPQAICFFLPAILGYWKYYGHGMQYPLGEVLRWFFLFLYAYQAIYIV